MSVVDSPCPAAAYRYAATQRPDCPAHSSHRYAALPMVMLLAERFASTVAPASAPQVEGGIGVQTSSQISTCSENPAKSAASKTRSLPNGTSWSSSLTTDRIACVAEANCRFS